MDVKFVGFLSLIGGAAALIGNFVPRLNQQYYLVPIGAGIAALTGIVVLISRKY